MPRGDEHFYRQVAECESFYRINGRLPGRGKDADAQEKPFGEWIQRQRLWQRGYGGHSLSKERRAVLDEKLPGWLGRLPDDYNREGAFRSTVELCAAFQAKHGRLPIQGSADKEESRLANWLTRCREARRGHGTLRWNPQRQHLLDEAMPGWNEPNPLARNHRRADERFRENAKACAVFKQTHKRFPRQQAGLADERFLGNWLAEARYSARGNPSANKRWTTERQQLLDTLIPGWMSSPEDRFLVQVQECARFYRIHGRFPSLNKHATAQERRMAEWLSKLRSYETGRAVNRRWTDARKDLLDRELPDWHGDRRRTITSANSADVNNL